MPTDPHPPSSATGSSGAGVLIGRDDELAVGAERIGRLVAGNGSAWTYVGDAGSGKSALVEDLARRAVEAGVEVVAVAGNEAGGSIAWAALADLCRPFVGLIDEVQRPRALALRTALAMDLGLGRGTGADDGDEGGPDALAVALGFLELLAEGAARLGRGVLVVVDDLQWIDAESRSVLAFVAKRLADDPIALVAAARPDPGAVVGEAVVVVALADPDVRALLVRAGVRSRPAQDALVELSAGRPLLALRLAAGLRPEERSGSRPLPSPLRLPDDVRDLYRPAIDQLGSPARRGLLVAAADRSSDVDVVDRALRTLGGSIEDLAEAEAAGLVEVEGARLAFTHPLVRSAAYHGADAPRRREAHRALAEIEGTGSSSGILHRAASIVGRDDALADDLAALAEDASALGAPLTAASRWAQSAAAATAASVRADRLVAAARSALDAGDVAWAEELLDAAAETHAERANRLDARLVEARRAVAAGRPELARRVAEATDEALAEVDPTGVAEVLVEVARALLVEDPVAIAPLVERAWALAGDDVGSVGLRAAILHGCLRGVLEPGPDAEELVGRWAELLDREGPVRAGPFLADSVVLYLGYTGRRPAAHELLDCIERPIRASGASGALISVLNARSFLAYGTDLRSCVLAGREALELAEETGQPGLSSVALDTLAIAAANVGDVELTEHVCRRELASGSQRGEVWARAALARLHLVQDRPELAAEQFALLRRRIGGQNRSFTQFEGDEAEALVRLGRLEEARALLEDLAADAEARGGWSEAQHQRILALVAPDIDTAVGHFERARDALAGASNRIAEGIVELTWGEWLRRAKRRAEARRHLSAAIERFDLAGAVGLRRRAEVELVAAGGATDRGRPTDELLAPLELQVARLAVAGQTNRTIASELFVSPRTVENHLGSVYRKLGVSGRPGLQARASDDPVLRPVAEAS